MLYLKKEENYTSCKRYSLNLIHINNMKTVTEAGGIICPATPSFYSNPSTFEELASTVVDRVIALSGIEQDSYHGDNNPFYFLVIVINHKIMLRFSKSF